MNFEPAGLRLAVDFAGPEHVVMGSDYPHMIGSLEKTKSSIAAMELSAEAEALVQGGNAAGLLGL